MTITYRQVKGSALLYGEVDENFRDLLEDTDLQRVLTNGNIANLDLTANTFYANNVTANAVTITTAKTPLTAADVGVQGQIAWDANYIYVCVANNTWKRSALTTWV